MYTHILFITHAAGIELAVAAHMWGVIRVSLFMYVNVYMHIYIYTCIITWGVIRVCLCMYVRLCMHMYIYMYNYMYV